MTVVRTGPRGGKYILSRGRKVYLSSMSPKNRRKTTRDTRKPKPKKRKKPRKSKFG